MKTKNNPKISIITPSYNSGNQIERAIKSVLKQDYKNWEHIIIDGKSTDNTIKILKKYPHLKWISEKDKGQSDAMNKGFKMSSGNIIVYLNADDYFYPNAFSSVIKEFNKGAKFVVGNIKVISPRLKASFINTPRITLEGMLRHWEPNAFPVNPVGYFYLKEVQKKCPFNIKNKYTMDLEFLIDASSKYNFTKIKKILGCFEDGKDTKTGLSQSKLDYWQIKNFSYIDKYLNVFSGEERSRFFKDRRDGYCYMQAQMNNLNNNPIKLIDQKKAPLISIIIPTHNDSSHICRAIDSVLAQETKNIEIIVIDDLSTDNTKQVLNSKYSDNNKVKLFFQKENKKQGYQRNFGIKKAKGKYIFFVDSDDWISKGTLMHLLSIAENYKCDMVACGINKINENNTSEFYHGYDFGCRGKDEGLNYFTDYKIGSVIWNKLYLKSFIKKNNLKFITPYFHEDVTFSAEAIYKCKNYLSISTPYYNYFQRKSSTINSKPSLFHLRSYLRLLTNLSDFININHINGELAHQLIQSHAINNVIPNLLRYNSSHPNEWKKDYIRALEIENVKYPDILAELISSLLTPNCIINTDPQQTNNNISITNTELKIINGIRKIKHKIIPQDSIRKKIFEKIKKFRH